MAKAGDGAVRETMAVEEEGAASPSERPGAEEFPVQQRGAADPSFVQTLREVMHVRLAKFASCILFITVVAAIFAPWLTVSPGVAIFLVVLAFNFFGDALRDVLDPKLKDARQS